ncbi:MAG: hypothetical protein HQL28_04820 [Candidatus Omnitrophica bacterium]|nr:hypothetical protein [Candidatus Omnitrophota bacterium]
MLEKLFSSRARVDILKLFLFNRGGFFYQRQIENLTSQPIRAVQREIKKLLLIGIIRKKEMGKRTYYELDDGCAIVPELKKMFLKTELVPDDIKKRFAGVGSIKYAFIYGSYADSKEGFDSDLDVMIIGESSGREISKLLSGMKLGIGREINYSVFSLKEINNRLASKDNFITGVFGKPKIFIAGNENEFRKTFAAG